MLLQKKASLEEIIVKLLALNPKLSAKEIYEKLKRQGLSYSLRGIYKELTKLEALEIVFKVKDKYRVRLTWIINLLAFADSAYDSYTEQNHLVDLLSSQKKKTKYKFNSLSKLDLYWMQLMMALHKLYPNEPMFLWCPYQWFHLVHDYTVRQFFTAVDISGAKRYHIIGSGTYLERLAIDSFPRNSEYSFSESPFSDDMNTYFTFIGDHIISAVLPSSMTKKIDSLFNAITREKDNDKQVVSDLLNQDVKTSLIIEENPKKIKKLKKKFVEFFGIREQG